MGERTETYRWPAITLHWLVAGLILLQIPLAYYMIGLPLSPDKLGAYAWHKSLGLCIFGLSAIRLAYRLLRHPPPPLPGPRWQLTAAAISHGILYFVTFAMPLSGWLNSSAANFPVSLFGWITLPDLVGPDPELQQRMELLHRLLAYTLMSTLTAHACAALWHHFLRGDDTLRRMLGRFTKQ